MPEDLIEKMKETLIPFIAEYGVQVLGAIIILIVGRIAAGVCRSLVKKAVGRTKVDPAVGDFVGGMVFYGVIAFTVIAALSKFGVQTTSFVAVIGAAGLAVGLAMQGALANFASGVLILIFRPFRSEDFIEAADAKGVVEGIGIFTTTLRSPDNKKLIIPNAAVTRGTITNYNANGTRRIDLVASISYIDDMRKAQEVLHEMLKKDERILDDPAPTVAVHTLNDSSVDLVVRPWVKAEDYWDVYFDTTRAIKEALEAAGLSIPFPQHDVHLLQETAS